MVQGDHVVGSLCAPHLKRRDCFHFSQQLENWCLRVDSAKRNMVYFSSYSFQPIVSDSRVPFQASVIRCGKTMGKSTQFITQFITPDLESTWEVTRCQDSECTGNSHRCHGLSFHDNHSCSKLQTIPLSLPQLPPTRGNTGLWLPLTTVYFICMWFSHYEAITLRVGTRAGVTQSWTCAAQFWWTFKLAWFVLGCSVMIKG